MEQPEAQAQGAVVVADIGPVTPPTETNQPQMNAQLLNALADIIADALLADLEAEVPEVEGVSVSTAQSPRGTGSRKDQDQLPASSNLAPDAAQLGDPADSIVVQA
jgi:hypothetical protein